MKASMKKMLKTVSLILASGLISMQVYAADYSKMSVSELSEIRGTLRTASLEDRNEFQTAWQTKISKLSPDERAKLMGPPANSARDGQGYGNRKGQMGNQGNGKMMKNRGGGKGMGKRGQGQRRGYAQNMQNRRGGKGMGQGQGYGKRWIAPNTTTNNSQQ